MTLPKALISTAALGTAQHDPEALDAGTPLADLLAQLDPADRPARLLATAAALTLQQQAGWLPQQDHRPLPAPCPPDETQPCGPRAMRQLMIMLDGHYAAVLPEWLSEIVRAGQRAPEESLPLLLDTGRKRADLRDMIAPVLGNRGRWLADQVKDRRWNWAGTANVEKSWQSWTTETRLMALESLRRADPAAARQIVIDKWDAEDRETRIELLKCFRIRLSMEDEPFLESMLDADSPFVRHTALELISSLPESRLSGRMRERLIQYVTVAKIGFRRQLDISWTFPKTLAADMLRDGILGSLGDTTDSSESKIWLGHILRVVPPSFWMSHWNLSYQDLFEAAARNDQAEVLYGAWTAAAQRVGDFEFVERLTLDLLRRHTKGLREDHPAFSILRAYDHPWSVELTRAALISLKAYLSSGRIRPSDAYRTALLQFALNIPPELAAEFLETLNVETSAEKVWTALIDEIRLLLEFRRDVLTAIRNKE